MTSQFQDIEADTAHIRITYDARKLFDFIANPGNLDLWSFGTWRKEIFEDGLVLGRSIFDGASIYLRIESSVETGVVDFFVGPDPSKLERRIFMRVLPVACAGTSGCEETDLILIALRTSDMDQDRWDGLKTSHAFEVRLIKRLIESGFDHRQM